MTQKDFDDVIDGMDDAAIFAPTTSEERKRGASHLRLIRAGEDIPDTPEELARGQYIDAVQRIHEDSSKFFSFPLPSLHALAGPMAPGELWVVGGRQGNGKSLFMQNMAAWLLSADVPTLYMGTEQDAPVLRVKQACVIAQVSAKLILKPTDAERRSTFYREGAAKVQDVLKTLDTAPANRVLNFSNNRYISRAVLDEWIEVSVGEWGCRVIIVDHLHHMEHGEGRNPVEELTRTVHHAHDLAVKHHITVAAASQIKRTMGDPLKQYTPPAAEDFAGASAIERTADIIFSLWRPLRLDLTDDDMRKLREKAKLGKTAEEKLYEPFTMGVRCTKDRLGDAPGAQTYLAVVGGRLEERGRDAHATDYDSLRTV